MSSITHDRLYSDAFTVRSCVQKNLVMELSTFDLRNSEAPMLPFPRMSLHRMRLSWRRSGLSGTVARMQYSGNGCSISKGRWNIKLGTAFGWQIPWSLISYMTYEDTTGQFRHRSRCGKRPISVFL